MSVYGSFGASHRPATAPGAASANLKLNPMVGAADNTATRKCAGDIDFETIVALTRQFTSEVHEKQSQKQGLLKMIGEAKRVLKQNESLLQRKRAHVEKIQRETIEISKNVKEAEAGNTKLKQELQGVQRDNEKLAVEVETMTEQMQELISAFEQHRVQCTEVKEMISTYRREITNLKKSRVQISDQIRDQRMQCRVSEEKASNIAKRKQLMKTVVADVFVASAS